MQNLYLHLLNFILSEEIQIVDIRHNSISLAMKKSKFKKVKYHSKFGNEQRLTKSKAKNSGKEQQDCDPHTLLGGNSIWLF